MSRRTVACLAIAWLYLWIGCIPKGFQGGHFEGVLYSQDSWKKDPSLSSGVSALFLKPLSPLVGSSFISIDIQFEKNNRGRVDVKDSRGLAEYHFNLDGISLKKFYLTSPFLQPEPVEMALDPTSPGCFVSHLQLSMLSIEFCLRENQFTFQVSRQNEIPHLTLMADRFVKEAPFLMEPPTRLTLAQAVEIALEKNFDSRIQFEHTLQARLAAKTAYLNLFPRLNLSNLMANAPLTFFSVFGVIGDMVPFLLPNRWFMAHKAGELARAEHYAQILMQADLATEVEGLGYVLERDLSLLQFTQDLIHSIGEVRDQVLALELEKQFPIGSSRHLSAYLNSLEVDSVSLQQIIRIDNMALAQALGYHNPEAIEKIEFDQESVPIEKANPLKLEELGPLALGRSFELQQVDALIQYAERSKKELFFSWLDPSADSTLELGLAIGSSLENSRSRIRELKVQREKLQTGILQKMATSINQYNSALEIYSRLTKGIQLQEERIRNILEQVRPNSDLNTIDMKEIYQDYTDAWIRQKNSETDFRIARANVDRLLLQGYYSAVFSHTFSQSIMALSSR